MVTPCFLPHGPTWDKTQNRVDQCRSAGVEAVGIPSRELDSGPATEEPLLAEPGVERGGSVGHPSGDCANMVPGRAGCAVGNIRGDLLSEDRLNSSRGQSSVISLDLACITDGTVNHHFRCTG